MAFEPTALRLGLALLLILLTSVSLRILAILPSRRAPSAPRTTPSHLCIVLGSGGHTAEMLSMIRNLDPVRYHHRTYIVSSGDAFSALKAVEFERRLQETAGSSNTPVEKAAHERGGRREGNDNVISGPGYDILTVPRARKIHQSLLTTPLTSLLCLLACLRALSPARPAPTSTSAPWTSPDLILTNGPATGVLVILAAFILRFFGLAEGKLRSVYVESWARVGGLSLSGRVLEGMGLVERFLVQWEKGLGEGEGEEVERVGGRGRGKRRGGREWWGFLVA